MTNVATTVWVPNNSQQGEYSVGTAVNLADPVGVSILDPSSVSIVDTGVTYTQMPNTVWATSEGA